MSFEFTIRMAAHFSLLIAQSSLLIAQKLFVPALA